MLMTVDTHTADGADRGIDWHLESVDNSPPNIVPAVFGAGWPPTDSTRGIGRLTPSSEYRTSKRLWHSEDTLMNMALLCSHSIHGY